MLIDTEKRWEDKLASLRRGSSVRLLQAATNPHLLNGRDVGLRIPMLDSTNLTLLDRLAHYSQIETPQKFSAMIDLLRPIALEGGKVVIWSAFLQNLDAIAAVIKKEVTKNCYQVDGRVPTGDESELDAEIDRVNALDVDTREQVIDRFLTHPDASILIANPASCSESISLHTACHTAIYADRTFDCAQFLQSIDRIHRLGLAQSVNVKVHVLCSTSDDKDTIDHVIDASLKRKQAAMQTLLEGTELRPLSSSASPLEDAIGDEEDLASVLRYLLGE